MEALDNIPVWSVLPSTAALNEESLKGLLMGTMSGRIAGSKYRFYPVESSHESICLKCGRSCCATL